MGRRQAVPVQYDLDVKPSSTGDEIHHLKAHRDPHWLREAECIKASEGLAEGDYVRGVDPVMD